MKLKRADVDCLVLEACLDAQPSANGWRRANCPLCVYYGEPSEDTKHSPRRSPQQHRSGSSATPRNGSRWDGEEVGPVDQLFSALAEHPLARRFEVYGNFIFPHESALRQVYEGAYATRLVRCQRCHRQAPANARDVLLHDSGSMLCSGSGERARPG